MWKRILKSALPILAGLIMALPAAAATQRLYIGAIGSNSDAALLWDSTNKRLSVNSTTPYSTLVVQGSSTAPNIPVFTAASSTGASLFTVLANGNVGIGTTNPTNKLDVIGGSLTDTQSVLNVTATLPSSLSGTTSGAKITITGASSDSQNVNAMAVTLAAGYTGTSATAALRVTNQGQSNTSNATAIQSGVWGEVAGTYGSGTDTAAGVVGYVNDGAVNANLIKIGVFGRSRNNVSSGSAVGGFFSAEQTSGGGTGAVGVYGRVTTGNDIISNVMLGPGAGVFSNGGTTYDILRLYDNSTLVFSVIDGGNVGIGTTAPSSRLDIKAGSAGATLLTMIDSGGGVIGQFVDSSGSNGGGLSIIGIRDAGGGGTGLQLTGRFDSVNNTAGVSVNVTDATGASAITAGAMFAVRNNGTEAFRVHYDGSVGIGVTSPLYKLEVAGYASTTLGNLGNLYSNGTVAGVNASSSTVSLLVQGTTTLNPFQVNTSTGISLFRVNTNGSIAVGTTTNSSMLFVQGTTTLPTLDYLTIASSTGSVLLKLGANGGIGYATTTDATSTLTIVGNYYSYEYDNGTSSPGTIDWGRANVQRWVLSGNGTFTFTNTKPGGRYALFVYQDGTGSRIADWPAGVHWSGAASTTLTTTAGKFDLVTFLCALNGTCAAAANTNYAP